MGKNPAFQFYPNDWSRDLEEHPLEIRGAWITICCKLWYSETRGELNRTITQWSKILGVDEDDTKRIINYIEKWSIGNVVTDGNGSITVMSRRMLRDEKDKELNALRQQKFREKHACNGGVTPHVTAMSHHSSSSTSTSKKSILTDEEFLLSLKEKFTWVDFDQVMVKMDAWLLAHPARKKTRRFIVNWLNKIEKPIEVKNAKSW